MNFLPKRKKLVVSIGVVLIVHIALPVIFYIKYYKNCINYVPNLTTFGVSEHLCEREINIMKDILDMIFSVPTDPLYYYLGGILFLLVYLIYSFFEKR